MHVYSGMNCNKQHITQTMKKLSDTCVAKVSTLTRSAEDWKVCVGLVPDYDALDAVDRIRVI